MSQGVVNVSRSVGSICKVVSSMSQGVGNVSKAVENICKSVGCISEGVGSFFFKLKTSVVRGGWRISICSQRLRSRQPF